MASSLFTIPILYIPRWRKSPRISSGNGRDFRFWKLGGAVTVVSFDVQFAERVPQIQSLVSKNRPAWSRFCTRRQAKKVLPRPVFKMLKRAFSPVSQTH